MDEHARARELILEGQRGTLAPVPMAELRAHLAACAECRHEETAEGALTRALDQLPQHPASLGLKRRLAELAPGPQASPAALRPRWRTRALTLAAATVLLGAVALPLALQRVRLSADLAGEVVQSHLGVLDGSRPLQIVSSGIHEVKPWFAGKLDFAPQTAFAGDADFPLQGGAVGIFRGRRAATLVYKRRTHLISLFIVRADGLSWPSRSPVGRERGGRATVRGFNLLVWKQGDLGYALVSDLDGRELSDLAAKVAG